MALFSIAPTSTTTMAAEETVVEEREESPVRVFLRLRPLNKFESSRRSRNAVDILDDNKTVACDAPEGEIEVRLDGVSPDWLRRFVHFVGSFFV